MTIRNLPARYPELGRIRFGDKGPKGEPRKGKTLRFSSNDDVALKALASQHGGEVVEWAGGEQAWHLTTETLTVPILLPPDPIDTWYEKWGKGGIARRCDGERCTIPVQDGDGGFMEERDCACLAEGMTPGDREDVKHGACQVTVRFRVVLPDVPGIGIWLATSHSIYAALELPGQVALLEVMRSRGQLIPAELAIEPRTEKKPWEKFKRDFIVPVLRIRASYHQLESGTVPTAGALGPADEDSTAPALTAASGEGGDGASPVETTAEAAIGNGSTEASPAPAKRSGTAAEARTTTRASNAAESPWVGSVRTQAAKRDLVSVELDAFIECVAGEKFPTLASLNDNVGAANTVLAALPIWTTYTLAFEDGKPFFTEPEPQGAAK